jgi:hypothetical protein
MMSASTTLGVAFRRGGAHEFRQADKRDPADVG